MTITIYRSTDSGAPSFAPNVKGSLISVLDACLVNGYGTKSPLGWTKDFSGSRAGTAVDPWAGGQPSAAAYKMPAGSTGAYLYVTDLRHMFYVQGYETLTSIDQTTGTGQFPRQTMLADATNHCGWSGFKADTTTETTALKWELISNGSMIYFLYQPRSSTYWYNPHSGKDRAAFAFGDIKSYRAGDAYRTVCFGMGNVTAGHSLTDCFQGNSSSSGYRMFEAHNDMTLLSATAGQYPCSMARGLDGGIGGIRTYPLINYALLNASGRSYGPGGGGAIGFPNQTEGGVYLETIRLREFVSSISSHIIRGELPGMYMFCHTPGLLDIGQQFTGTGAFAGRLFEIFGFHAYYSTALPFSCIVIDVTPSGSWS